MTRYLHLLASLCLIGPGVARGDPSADWPYYGQDPGGARYSPLDQIDRGNVGRLKQAWVFHTGELGEGFSGRGKMAFEATPILRDGRLYLSTPLNEIQAIDPLTGKLIWRFDPGVERAANYAEATSRGVSYWSGAGDGLCAGRIFQGTLDARLTAVDAATGGPCPEFGEDGQVDLSAGVRLKDRGDYLVTSPPAVLGALVIVGSAIGDNRAVELERGVVRAFDAMTGELVWSWDPIPTDRDDPAWAEWGEEGAALSGGANAWSIISVDAERDLVFIPTTAPSPDFYGGLRPGRNEHANSLVALRGSTGAPVWHQQLVHHDVWDYDLPAQPMLVELTRDGRVVPAVVQTTKMGMLFVFHRETGEPLFPIEERPVPQGGVAGETLSPTQPFPVAPPPLVPHTPVTADDAYGLTPWDRKICQEKIEKYRSDGIYTPPSLQGTIMYPGYAGGSNWGGLAWDPQRQLVIANTMNLPMVVRLVRRDQQAEMIERGEIPATGYSEQHGTPYVMYRGALLSTLGIPCTPPPWGQLAAVDLGSGEIRWQVPLGTIEEDAPAIIPNLKLGVPNIGGAIVTAGGLVFIAATTDYYLRAFDIDTGEELWRGRLPTGGQATPMTYSLNGTQYIVVAAGGHGNMGVRQDDALVAFRLR